MDIWIDCDGDVMDGKFFVFAGGIIRILVGSDMLYDNDLARFWLVCDDEVQECSSGDGYVCMY